MTLFLNNLKHISHYFIISVLQFHITYWQTYNIFQDTRIPDTDDNIGLTNTYIGHFFIYIFFKHTTADGRPYLCTSSSMPVNAHVVVSSHTHTHTHTHTYTQRRERIEN